MWGSLYTSITEFQVFQVFVQKENLDIDVPLPVIVDMTAIPGQENV